MRTIAHIEKDFSNTRNFLSLKEFFTIKAVRKSYELLQKIKQFLSKTSQL